MTVTTVSSSSETTDDTNAAGTRTIVVTIGQFRTARAFLADGASNRIVAKRMALSIDTVKTQMKYLFLASGCTDRASLAVAFWTGAIDFSCKTNPSLRDSMHRIIDARKFIVNASHGV